MVGILVDGDNHFIVQGPAPDDATAHALASHWSLIRIGATVPEALTPWTIRTKEFRENLQWAVVLEGNGPMNPAVQQLLDEMAARGVNIRDLRQRAG